MGVFTFGEHVGDLLREMTAERRARRQALESGVRLSLPAKSALEEEPAPGGTPEDHER